jgi:hypothetical protein
MEMTRRDFVGAIPGVVVACVRRGEGVPPLRLAGILPVRRGKAILATEDKGGTPSPHGLREYPGEVVPMGDITKQSKWSG